MKRIILNLLTLLFTINLTAQNSETRFFIEIENENDIYAGQAFRVQYLSNRPIKYMDIPEWGKEIEILNAQPARISRSSITNGKKVNSTLNGVTYTVRVRKAGKIIIPATTAIINRQRYTCKEEKVKIHAPKKMKTIHCSFATKPKEVTEGTRFLLILSCDYRPDKQPTINAEGLRLITTSTSTSIINGKKKYEYTFNLMAPRKGEYQITPRNLTFNGAEYDMEPYIIKVLTKRVYQAL